MKEWAIVNVFSKIPILLHSNKKCLRFLLVFTIRRLILNTISVTHQKMCIFVLIKVELNNIASKKGKYVIIFYLKIMGLWISLGRAVRPDLFSFHIVLTSAVINLVCFQCLYSSDPNSKRSKLK